jgi:hypothetical protein
MLLFHHSVYYNSNLFAAAATCAGSIVNSAGRMDCSSKKNLEQYVLKYNESLALAAGYRDKYANELLKKAGLY